MINARDGADFVVCLLHAGDEMVSFPVERKKELPRFLLANGVDVVVRSGPHALQGHETRGTGLILYSPGISCSMILHGDGEYPVWLK